jgi:hypothetical protein
MVSSSTNYREYKMTIEKNTKIAGYNVMLMIEGSGEDQMTHCYINSRDFSSSLEGARNCGEDEILQADFNRIEKWALANGY